MSALSLIDPFSSNSTSAPKSKPSLSDFNSTFESDTSTPAPVVKQAAASKEPVSLSLAPKKHTQTLFPKIEKKETVIEEASPPPAAAEPKLFKEEKLNKELVELNDVNHATRELSTKLHNALIEKINLTKTSCDKNIEMTKEAIEHICNSTRNATTTFNETVAKAMEAQKAVMLQFVSAAQEFGNWVQKESMKLNNKKRKKREEAQYPSSESEEDSGEEAEDTSMSASEESELDEAPIIETKRKKTAVSAPTKKVIQQHSKKAKAAKSSPVLKSFSGRQLPAYC